MKTYAIVGAGGRALHMFAQPIAAELQEHAKLIGICDPNPVRARIMSETCGGVPTYKDFDAMIAAGKPDAVIITTPDSLHDEYIIRALEAGCDAVSEKPMTTDAAKCRAILEAEERTGQQVIVTFNCRFIPYVARIRELIAEGTIGPIQSVTLEWSLDRVHGADYFRRWHRQMKNSGGLLVHKSTHHFDMVNWWLDDEPESVYANGALLYYGSNGENSGERCSSCAHASECDHYYDIGASDFTRTYYQEAEQHDGYYRDQCVFGEDVDIYDTMSLNVKYRGGTLLTYSLNAYSPYEGWKATFVGTRGRIEAQDYHSGAHVHDPLRSIQIYNQKGEQTTVQVAHSIHDHGGGDKRLRRMLFARDIADPLGQQAGSRAGAMSLLIGAAANQSIAEHRPIRIQDLLFRS
jgi:predicted dehydrogenase